MGSRNRWVWVSTGRRPTVDGDSLDDELLRTVAAVSRGRSLTYIVRERLRGRVFPLLSALNAEHSADSAPREVGFLRDEDVSIVDGRRVVSLHRQLTVEADAWVVDWVHLRLEG